MAGSERGGRSRSPLFRGRAFSLAELLAVLAICLVLGGGMSLAVVSSFAGPASDTTAVREGKYAAQWLQRIFHKALLSGRSFVFRLSTSVPQNRLKIQWADGREETYDGKGRVWFTNHSGVPAFCAYSPKWNTISPAFTIEAGSSPDRRRPLKYIVVTPFCRVSYRDDPPRD
ncbi:hypothetical protein SDC9_38147 [bioreactor metagenome]|jgi:hypothetical protein|uniref:General secretion pathway GspH domain-containing protein n=1 Tax=bioreactor metagenome TaxID=1076179 RepID=A0A644VL73_9ZZZZ|nr:hypothetical protein [Aminivibrio sp.]NCB16266.1 hypothetical protein [Synergistales bacterium]HPF83780.1 hypothetical protein [Aminivibrio sp.]